MGDRIDETYELNTNKGLNPQNTRGKKNVSHSLKSMGLVEKENPIFFYLFVFTFFL